MPETSNTPSPTKSFNLPVNRRAALDAFKRLQPVRDGQSRVVRFLVGARIEHLIVMVSFVVLAITGMVQSFVTTRVAQAIIIPLGGLEGTQQIHHFFALILMAVAIYHLAMAIDSILVRLQPAAMLPGKNDFNHFFQMVTFNLGISRKIPLYGRYTFDEKFVYWVTVISVLLLSLTGLVMWFPSVATQILPGSAYLYAIAIHRWQALFAVVVMLLLHLYQVMVRRQNFSIFSGEMNVADMQAEHPVELAYLEQAAALAEAHSIPKTVKFSVDEIIVNKPARVKRIKPGKTETPVETFDGEPVETSQLETIENLAINNPPTGETL